MLRKGSRSIMGIGALGAITSLVLIPAINSKTRKRVTRSARNAYFRVTDLFQDIKDMTHR